MLRGIQTSSAQDQFSMPWSLEPEAPAGMSHSVGARPRGARSQGSVLEEWIREFSDPRHESRCLPPMN
jgi:hypothetical protein